MSVLTREAVSTKALTWRGRGLTWESVVRVLAPLGALALEGWAALIGAWLVQEGGLWLTRRLGRSHGECTQTLLSRLFLAAYGLRMSIALPTHYVAKLGDGNGALFRDDYTNDLVGEWLVRIARGEFATAIFPGHQYLLSSVYSYLLMAIYAVFGYAPLLPKIVNIGLAALCAVLTFDIARKIYSRRVALIAAGGAVVLPSLVVWSIATLKETLVLFTALVALWLTQFLTVAPSLDRRIANVLVALLAVGLLLLDLRASTAAIALGLVLLVLIARSRVRLRTWQVAVAGLVIVSVLVGAFAIMRVRTTSRPLSATFEDIALQVRHRRAQEAAGANSQLRQDRQVLSANGSELPQAELASDAQPFSVVGDVIDPLGYALLAPTPWQAQSLTELAASAEMPVWYLLLAGSAVAWWAMPRQRLFFAVLVAYAVANWLILAAVEGNVGNLLRHRLTVDPVLLILGAAGLDLLWIRLRGSRPYRLSR